MIRKKVAWVASSLFTMAGCALTSKSEPLSPKYYSPAVETPSSAAESVGARKTMPELRLGRIVAAAHLGERIVYRDSSREIGFYDDRRWSEKPDVYLRRELANNLFEQRGFHRIVGGIGPTLDVELTDFEELRGPAPSARARATFILQDGRSVIRERTITIDSPIKGNAQPTADQTVAALSQALSELVSRITAAVTSELDSRAAPQN